MTLRSTATAAAAVLLVTVAACSEQPSEEQSAQPDATEPAEGESRGADAAALDIVADTPEPAGPVESFTWVLPAEPATIDTDRQGDDSVDTVVANVCERLFVQQPDLTVVPGLASDVSRPDQTTMVLSLRRDVRFHDGSTMTADDVVWSLRRHAQDGMEESDEFETVDSIEATGPNEVTITFTQPTAPFVQSMAGDAGIVLNEQYVKEHGEDYGTPGSGDACSGPYQVADWNPGSALVLERFEDYWNDDHAGLAEELRFVWADEAAAVNALRTGEADGGYFASPTATVPLQESDSVTTYWGPTTLAYSLLPTGRGPATDPSIRRALSLVIDRGGIAQAGFNGLAQPWNLPIGPGAWGYARATFAEAQQQVQGAPPRPTEESITTAKELVQEVGAPEQPIIVASDGSSYRNVIANAVKDAGSKIGLTVEIKTVSQQTFDTYYVEPAARSDVDLVPVGWYISKSEPLGVYDNMTSGSANNWIGFSDPEYDSTVERAMATFDDQERAELVLELQDIWTEKMLWIPLVQPPNALVMSSDLTGAPPSVASLAYPWAADVGRAQ